jgi:Kef-type K+ transport system membrane component KefB
VLLGPSLLGLIFFMYLLGSEMNLSVMRERGVVAVTVSQVSITLPMLTGVALAFALYPSFGDLDLAYPR